MQDPLNKLPEETRYTNIYDTSHPILCLTLIHVKWASCEKSKIKFTLTLRYTYMYSHVYSSSPRCLHLNLSCICCFRDLTSLSNFLCNNLKSIVRLYVVIVQYFIEKWLSIVSRALPMWGNLGYTQVPVHFLYHDFKETYFGKPKIDETDFVPANVAKAMPGVSTSANL